MSVSIGAMRDRLLAQLSKDRPPEDWVAVLASAGNRDLLGLIARARPQSIGALADLAGRAQPNVSRALTSLVSAGLVETRNDGRRTIPAPTALGLEKARDFGLIDAGAAAATHVDGDRLMASRLEGAAPVGDGGLDAVPGALELTLWERWAAQASGVALATDLAALSERVLADWWRLLYRRDSVWRFGEFVLGSTRSDRPVMVSLKTNGRDVRFLLRDRSGDAVALARDGSEPVVRVEDALLEALLRPVAGALRASGRVDRRLHSMLSRLEESREDPEETAFCRTAGALDISPYDLSDAVAADVGEVVAQFPDEDARLDFASSLAVDELRDQSDWLRRELARHSATNGLGVLERLRGCCARVGGGAPMQPWRLGRDCARAVRAELGLGVDGGVHGVRGVAALFGSEAFQVSEMAPGALRGFQTMADGLPVVFVEDEGPNPTAFTLCRAVGDYLVHGSRTACVANIYTERQKVGRAFAAEFLAPGEGVLRMAEEEGQSSGRIARHYGVSPEVVSRQYQNYSREA